MARTQKEIVESSGTKKTRKMYRLKTANDVEKTIQNSELLQRLLEVK